MLRRGSASIIAAGLAAVFGISSAQAQSLSEALALAYANNPTLNSARAGLRATDESVPQALAGYRPQLSGSIQQSYTTTDSDGSTSESNTTSLGLTVTQPIFRGYRTVNGIRQAESSVLAQRESLVSTEQNVLFDGAQSYMDVIRDSAIVTLRRSDIKFLESEVRAARDRFNVGEGTRTDVSQAEAELASAQSNLNQSIADLNSSRAIFRQVIGRDPGKLKPDLSVLRLLPKNVQTALDIAHQQHPTIRQAQHSVDVALFQVKSIEGELLPSVDLEGTVQRSINPNSATNVQDSATILGRVSIPIYQGGQVYSRVRQAKEQLGQSRIQVDIARDQIRATVIASWGQYKASEASIVAGQAGVRAEQLALDGVVEEQRVGQRTTQDVLDQQRSLVNARVSLVQAQRDRIVAAYALVSSVGGLTSSSLSLNVAAYQPTEHYSKVRDKWIGLRTPDGR
ncbi:MAG: TolC family outer membrane protein [Stappiaceae bacterium]